MSWAARVCFAIWVIAFAVGATTHLRDVLITGWAPRSDVTLPVGLFWKALTIIDPLVIALLATRRRAGLALGLLVMIVDVLVNSYIWYGLGVPGLAFALQLQSLFFGFVLGSIAFLWRAPA